MFSLRAAAMIVVVYLAVVGGWNAYVLNTPPSPVSAEAPADVFSAERAFKHIEQCAQKPHPIGSEENARIRDYLVATLQSLGYEAFVQRDPLFEGKDDVRLPENVYARLKGSDSTGAVLMMAHYDSTPFGPAAADDITGVSAILETARALKAGPPLRNDVIFFLTDGEENGLLGPKAFLQSHPWRADLKMVLNFEARGHQGPSMMFHTQPRNGGIVKEFLAAAPYPVSNSMMFDIAGRMPTATDYYYMKRKGVPGLDFAFVGGLKYYHTMNDRPENLDKGSVQHHGSYALALSRHFGSIDLNAVAWDADPIVYFNTLGHYSVHYSQAWIWPLSLLAVVAALVALGVAWRAGRVRAGHVLGALGVMLLSFLLVPVLTFVPVYLGFANFGLYAIYNQPYYVPGLFLLSTAIFLGLFSLLTRGHTAEERAAAVLLLSVPLCLAGTVLVPLGAYIFAWPLLAIAIGVLLFARLPETATGWRTAVALLCVSPGLLLVFPMLFSFFDTITFAPAPLMLLCHVLLLGQLLLALHPVIVAPGRALAAGLFALSLPILAFAVLNTTISPERPRMNRVDFGANFDTQHACWASIDMTDDEWTKQFFATASQANNFDEFDVDGTLAKRFGGGTMPAPSDARMEVTSDTVVDGRRKIAVLVRPGKNTSSFNLFTPPSVQVMDAKVMGVPFGRTRKMAFASWLCSYWGRSEGGVPFEFEVAPDSPFALTIIEVRYGLPEYLGAAPFTPRPAYMVPEPNTTPVVDFSLEGLKKGPLDFNPGWHSNRTFLRKTFTFADPAQQAAATP